ncbi:unnamed protein product [Allacma fusca]|uniref:Zinc phosphodiesterase ELAC protein 2 n=1 Tax=Allacma fusca TaxID=39272 RepID=A0A8J2KG29_9HEXA|nr:unnamed protein product [Allacma fusca]
MDSKSAHIPAMQAARKAKLENSPKYPPGMIFLQVLGTGANGAPTSLYIFADQTRYMFNCGEGSQRLAHEHKLKLGRLENVFITSKQWDKIGGLPGMALTIQDIGMPVLTLHGPPGLQHIFNATSRFIILKNLHIRAADCLDNQFYEDHVMRIEYVPIYPNSVDSNESPGSGSSDGDSIELDPEELNIDYYKPMKGFKRQLDITVDTASSKKIKGDGKTFLQDQEAAGNPFTPSVKCAMCYICRVKPKEGKLLVDKCVEKGVPPGPLLGELKAGRDITLKNGTVVCAKDVRSEESAQMVFVVADCPSEDYIDDFVSHPTWSKHQNLTEDPDLLAPSIVVHFTPDKIVLDPRYQEWMQKFGPKTQHMLLNSACTSLGSEAVHRLQQKLNLFDEYMFPLLTNGERSRSCLLEYDDIIGLWKRNVIKPITHLSEPALPPRFKDLKVPVILGEPLMKFFARPDTGFDTSQVVGLCPDEYLKEAMVMENFPEELARFKEKVASMDKSSEYPNILFSGTGSSIPNKARNVSGILLTISENTRMMLDCGEGTFGQLFRFFGPSEINRVLTELKAVYISHLHADHHLGLYNLLLARASAFENLNIPFSPLVIFAPHQILFWLRTYHHNFQSIRKLYDLVANVSLVTDYKGPFIHKRKQEILDSLELEHIVTCSVRHCLNAFGVAVKHKSGWKVCYSGDTQPCEPFITIGLDSDVCIHEATMEDELVEEARHKQHSTVSEAIEIGRRMNAKNTILTHFSQRYAKVPIFSGQLESNVAFAFDNMRVRISDIPKVPLMYPALKAVFQEDFEEMELRTWRIKHERETQIAEVELKAKMIAEDCS